MSKYRFQKNSSFCSPGKRIIGTNTPLPRSLSKQLPAL